MQMLRVFLFICLITSLHSHEKYKNIIFDLGQVMVEWIPTKMVDETFKNEERIPYELVPIFNTPIWLNYDAGQYSREELIEKSAAACDKELFSRLVTKIPQLVKVHPEMVALVNEVKNQGFKVYILSNMPKEIFQELNELNGLTELFDGQTVSYEVGKIKPHPAIYHHLLNTYSLNPEECFFIDDRDDNIHGAKRCGIDGVVYQDFHQLRSELKKQAILQ